MICPTNKEKLLLIIIYNVKDQLKYLCKVYLKSARYLRSLFRRLLVFRGNLWEIFSALRYKKINVFHLQCGQSTFKVSVLWEDNIFHVFIFLLFASFGMATTHKSISIQLGNCCTIGFSYIPYLCSKNPLACLTKATCISCAVLATIGLADVCNGSDVISRTIAHRLAIRCKRNQLGIC